MWKLYQWVSLHPLRSRETLEFQDYESYKIKLSIIFVSGQCKSGFLTILPKLHCFNHEIHVFNAIS